MRRVLPWAVAGVTAIAAIVVVGLSLPAHAALVAPALSASNVTATSVHLSWTDGGTESGYWVREVFGTSTVTLADVPDTTHDYDVTGLSPQTTHVYRVVAHVTGSQKRSNDVTITTLAGAAPCTGVDVVAPASIQAAIDANPTGTTFCLSGSFVLTADLLPKSDDTFTGPADITGSNATGFEIKTANATGVTLDTLTIHGFSIRGVDCWLGTVARNLAIYGNARNAFGCGLEGVANAGVLIETSNIYGNGSVAELGAGGGGMKFANADGVTIRNNHVYGNIGNGVWFDLDSHAASITGNTIEGNTRKGVFIEISAGLATISGNTVTENNCSPVWWNDGNPECDLGNGTFGPQGSGSPGGGIAANSSLHVTITGNILGGNVIAGINFRDDSRVYDAPFDISVTNNTLNGDALLKCGQWGIVCSGNA